MRTLMFLGCMYEATNDISVKNKREMADRVAPNSWRPHNCRLWLIFFGKLKGLSFSFAIPAQYMDRCHHGGRKILDRLSGRSFWHEEDEHDVVWFWLEKGKPHECPVCSQYFELEVVGPGG